MIDSYRQQLDEIDNEIISLLEKRFAITHEIGLLKKREGKLVRDKKREEAIIRRLAQGKEPFLALSIKKIYQSIFERSRQQQKNTLK